MTAGRNGGGRRWWWGKSWLIGLLGMIAMLAFWTAMAFWLRGGGGTISRLPTPLAVAGELVEYAGGDLWRDLAASVRVFFTGWLIGCVAATVLGLESDDEVRLSPL